MLRGNWWQALKCLIILELRQDVAGANRPSEQSVTGYIAFFPSLIHLQVHDVKYLPPVQSTRRHTNKPELPR